MLFQKLRRDGVSLRAVLVCFFIFAFLPRVRASALCHLSSATFSRLTAETDEYNRMQKAA